MTNNAILYEIVNTTTGKKYIGVTTTSLSERWNVHLYKLRKGIATKKLQDAFDDFGEQSFIIRKINTGSKTDMLKEEKRLTADTIKFGYNTVIGGGDFEERSAASNVFQE